MDILTKKTVLMEYRNRNLSVFDETMDEECLTHVALASGMLEGIHIAETTDYYEAWSHASSLLRDTLYTPESAELDVEYAVGRVSGIIFYETDDHAESIRAGRQELSSIKELDKDNGSQFSQSIDYEISSNEKQMIRSSLVG